MSDATVFSRSRQLVFEKSVTRTEVEGLLKKMLHSIGEQLSYNAVILGHIKVLARLSTGDDYLFLSLTRLDRVDVTASSDWLRLECDVIDNIELAINVLVFGYSSSTVGKVVDAALTSSGLTPKNI